MTSERLPRSLGGEVPHRVTPVRVDQYLSEFFPFFSRNQWQQRLEQGDVRVNERVVKKSHVLLGGERLTTIHAVKNEPVIQEKVKILSEFSGILIVEKPAGIPMHENGPFVHNTVSHQVRELAGAEFAPVHRLDKETSGLVICAHGTTLRRQLSELLYRGDIAKTYLCLVKGAAPDLGWRVDEPIGEPENSPIRIKKWVVPHGNGLSAITDFLCLWSSPSLSLLEAHPKTGRTNQIRIHAAFCGLPLVGDKLYHPDEEVFLDYAKNGTTAATIVKTGHSRCCLHAAALFFEHPQTKEGISVQCPMPEDMLNIHRSFNESAHLTNPLFNESTHL